VYRFAEGCGLCVNVCINEIICTRHDEFGESSGAALVGYHLLSPQLKILFKRGTLASDLPGQKYSFVAPDLLRERSLKLAALAGFNVNNWDNC